MNVSEKGLDFTDFKEEYNRIRKVYRDREARLYTREGFFNYDDYAHLFRVHERQRETLNLLKHEGFHPLHGYSVLDVGCGDGNMLRRFVDWGADQSKLHGMDLLPESVKRSRMANPKLDVREGSAASIPWPDQTFDIVCQHTVFSSILDHEMKRRVASEMTRVLIPGGAILWYDFLYNNPVNPNVRGVKISELKSLFSNLIITGNRITLAPPIARRIPKVLMPIVYPVLASAPFLRTHYLALMRKNR